MQQRGLIAQRTFDKDLSNLISIILKIIITPTVRKTLNQ